MITPGRRRLWITCLLCLFVLTLSPVSSGQKLTAADVPVLVKQLKNKDAKILAAAAWGLASLSQLAKPAIPALIETLRDSDTNVRFQSIRAIRNSWGRGEHPPEVESAIPALAELLKDESVYIRWHAVGALGSIGPAARAAIPAVIEMLLPRTLTARPRAWRLITSSCS